MEPWIAKDVRSLPHYESLRALSLLLEAPMATNLTVHLPGGNAEWPEFEIPPRAGAAEFVRAFDAIDKARVIATGLDCPLRFGRLVQDEDIQNIEKIHAIVTTGVYEGPGDRMVFTCTVDKSQWDDKALASVGQSLEVRIQGGQRTDKIFGCDVTYPLGTIILTNPSPPRVVRSKRRDEVRVEFRGSPTSISILKSAPQ
jgi:hypothetical protein